MNVRNTCARIAMRFFMCLAIAFSCPAASAQVVSTTDITVAVSMGSPVINLNNLNFGSTYYARNHATASASATVSPASVLTHNTGAVGSARLLPISVATPNKLRVNIIGGIPTATMNLSIMDDNTTTPFVLLTGQTTPADAVFRVDTWTFAIQPGGGALTFNPTTATGVVTLNGAGEIDIFFGATMRTVPGGLTYSAQDYTGTVRITANY